ncbi:apolipo B-100 [Chlorella sorokiniana]|uniref:Apolipo B-100 n=1 Tax=Chlorella sorokiniana TaxID=3076 RepID=A0A2P6TPL4_CHLSO|nr:apolipo B-100 [Chlorella sorokiniana]|eukprot:PRW55971.1 apolipo B-100 [Chlorella sorokiniana]
MPTVLAAHPGTGRAAAAAPRSRRLKKTPQTRAARPACPHRRSLPSRCQAGPAAQSSDGLKARIAASFDQLIVTLEGKQYVSVDKLLDLCAAEGQGTKEELAQALQQAVVYATEGRGELSEALQQAVVYATELRQQGSAPTLAGKPVKQVAAELVRHVEEKHQKHRMDLEEMLQYASHELEPQVGPSPALQLAMRQLRDRISDKLEKHVNAEREIDDLRKLVDASEEGSG